MLNQAKKKGSFIMEKFYCIVKRANGLYYAYDGKQFINLDEVTCKNGSYWSNEAPLTSFKNYHEAEEAASLIYYIDRSVISTTICKDKIELYGTTIRCA